MWTEGTIKTPTSLVRYWVKYFEEGSEFGIEGGRISKLMIRRETKPSQVTNEAGT